MQDVRVSTYPTVTGEKIVLRLYGAGVAELEQFLARTSGLLLLTGPAGSGNTTTIYACLRILSARRDRHIITVEDPAEQVVRAGSPHIECRADAEFPQSLGTRLRGGNAAAVDGRGDRSAPVSARSGAFS